MTQFRLNNLFLHGKALLELNIFRPCTLELSVTLDFQAKTESKLILNLLQPFSYLALVYRKNYTIHRPIND